MDELPKKNVILKDTLSTIGRDEQPRRIRIIHPFKKVDTIYRSQDNTPKKGIRWETIVSVLDENRMVVVDSSPLSLLYTGVMELRYFYCNPQLLQNMVDQDFKQLASTRISSVTGDRNWLADESLAQTWTIRYRKQGNFYSPTIIRHNNIPISDPERDMIEVSYPFWQAIRKEVDFTRFGDMKPAKPPPLKADPELDKFLSRAGAEVSARKGSDASDVEDVELRELLGKIPPKPANTTYVGPSPRPSRVEADWRRRKIEKAEEALRQAKAEAIAEALDAPPLTPEDFREKEEKPNPELGERKLKI